MTTDALPWDDIAVPAADYNVRLTASRLAIPVYWGKNPLGQRLLIVELAGDHSAEFNRSDVVQRGIEVDLRAGTTADTQRLVLTLQDAIDSQLFFGFCSVLLRVLEPVTDSAVALSVTIAHLRRWKLFWAGRRAGLLSPEQIRGLLAELTLLRTIYQSGQPHNEAVDSWTGADHIQHDFVLGDRAIEVKSVSGRERNSVRISSEDQLEAASSSLYLVVFRVSEQTDVPEARSLNDTVTLIESELPSAESIEQFQIKLASAGYAPLPDYDRPEYLPTLLAAYAVVDGFPRLVRSGLPHGLARVSYEIELETIAPFQCSLETALR